MNWGIDVSFAHSTVSYHDLARRGASFVIGYVSDDPSKDMHPADKRAIEAAGMLPLLVFEDTEVDMVDGAIGGRSHGITAFEEADSLGYDLRRLPLFAANDRDAHPADFATILAYMDAFAERIPRPGYYGDADSIEYLWAKHSDWWFWQSSSLAFGPGIAPHAHLVQRYNDPRVAGLPVDANDVRIDGIPWLGEDMFTDADRAMLTKIATQMATVSYTEGITLPAIAEIRGNARNAAQALVALHTAEDPATLAAQLAPLLHTVDPGQLQAALAQVLSQVKLSVPGA